MKYLIDSLQSYEMDYSDALCPMQNEPDQSFMGDHILTQPVTVNKFCMFMSTLMSTLKTPLASMCPPMNNAGLSITSPVSVSPDTSSSPSPILPTGQLNFLLPDQAAATLVPASENPESTNMAKLIPLAGIYIPDLPQCRGGWHIALQQWNDVNPKTGQALKDWPDEWFKDAMKSKTATKQSQWALIAHKFEW